MTTPTAVAAHAAATGMDLLTARRSLESARTASALQEIDEARRNRRAVRAYVMANRDRIRAEWDALPDYTQPARAAAEHLASLSPERRAALEGEWA